MKKYILVLTLSVFAGVMTAEVVEPKITSDRTVDTNSVEGILKDIFKGKNTLQEKAIALYEFQRLMVYHVNADKYGDNRDFMKSYNVYGHNLCGSQATSAVELARAAGCFTGQRVVGVPGHTIYELNYDGKWHTFDTMMNFYVFTNKDKNDIADLDQLKENPDLAIKAVEEGRACPGYLLCGDTPKTFTGGRKAVLDYKSSPSKDLMKYSLRKGESWTRYYLPQFEAPDWNRPLGGGVGPYHGCGGRDDKDSINFPFWEPYLISKYGKVSRSYRHWATGYWEYAPDLKDAAAISDAKVKDVTASNGVLRATTASRPGVFIYDLAHCPWLLVNGKFTAKVKKGNSSDTIKISAGLTLDSVKELWSAKDEGESKVDLDIFAGGIGKRAWNCVVKVEISAADPAKTGLSELNVKFGFIHNYPASPMLLPGDNRIKVECKPEGLKDSKLKLTYSWFEVEKDKAGPVYKTEAKRESKEISSSPYEFTITTPSTKKFPKMEFIKLECK